jgi:hypothetical protein
VIDEVFYEYFDPQTGEGNGADGISWTAPLFIALGTNYLQNNSSS